jgi:hypothetical protein
LKESCFVDCTRNSNAGVGKEAGASDTGMYIHTVNALVTAGVRNNHLMHDRFTDTQNNAIAAFDANYGPGVLDGFSGVLDLKDTPIGRKGTCGQIVTGSRGSHCVTVF